MSVKVDDLKARLEAEYEKIQREVKKPNILITGGTGVGKSSLINLCFGEDIAKVGVGKPVTDHVSAYASARVPLVLYDTVGYEIGTAADQNFVNEILAIASEKSSPDERIHLMWHCISASSHRITDFDLDVVRQLHARFSAVAIVLTKCDLVTEQELADLEQVLTRELPGVDVFRSTVNHLGELGHLDVDKLCDWAYERLPDALRDAFVQAQKMDLNLKRKHALKVILQHTSGSAAIGFIPIPFADAPILLANESAMLARILYLYNMESMLKSFGNLVGTFGVGTLVRNLGVWAVGELAKLLPVAGEIISGSVAASITAAMGYAVSELCYRIVTEVLDGNEAGLHRLLNSLQSLFPTLLKEGFKQMKILRKSGADGSDPLANR